MAIALWMLIIISLISADGLVEFKNLKCNIIDESFGKFEYCYIRAVNRTYKYISLKAKLFKVPITNVTVGIDVRKKTNGYQPFLLNVTLDACKFLRTKSNPLHRFMYSFIEQHSNLNHTCPYDHDLIVEKLDVRFIENQIATLLPNVVGDYALFTTWTMYNILRGRVDVYATLS